MLRSALTRPKISDLDVAHIFASRTINSFRQDALKHFDLTQIEWLTLCVVSAATKQGGIRVTDLAKTFDVQSTYITSLLNKLRTRGFIENRLDSADARVRRAVLTKKGTKQFAVIERRLQREIYGLLDDAITDDELRQYLAVTQKIASSALQRS